MALMSLNRLQACGCKFRSVNHIFTSHGIAAMRTENKNTAAYKSLFPLQTHTSISQNKFDRTLSNSSSTVSSSKSSWGIKLVNYAFHRIQPYLKLLRVDKPIGTFLLFWPCSWGLALAAPAGHLPDLWLLGIFALGSVLMRGAGCTINDVWDNKFDAQVERCATRPIPSQQVGIVGALMLFCATCLCGLWVLLQLSANSILLGLAIFPIIVLYPLSKRFFALPQLVLGICFNSGVLISYVAVREMSELPAVLPLYLGSIFWTMYYDTIYAHQDKHDDAKIGLKSSALTIGDRFSKHFCALFALTFMVGVATTAITNELSAVFWIFFSLAASRFVYQISSWNLNDRNDCLQKFSDNNTIGWLILLSISTGVYFDM